jgi:hypothetical protein
MSALYAQTEVVGVQNRGTDYAEGLFIDTNDKRCWLFPFLRRIAEHPDPVRSRHHLV